MDRSANYPCGLFPPRETQTGSVLRYVYKLISRFSSRAQNLFTKIYRAQECASWAPLLLEPSFHRCRGSSNSSFSQSLPCKVPSFCQFLQARIAANHLSCSAKGLQCRNALLFRDHPVYTKVFEGYVMSYSVSRAQMSALKNHERNSLIQSQLKIVFKTEAKKENQFFSKKLICTANLTPSDSRARCFA